MNADGSGQSRLADGVSPDWQPLVGPRREDYKNASHFCKAEREFLGAGVRAEIRKARRLRVGPPRRLTAALRAFAHCPALWLSCKHWAGR
jgi:hypothetical protein